MQKESTDYDQKVLNVSTITKTIMMRDNDDVPATEDVLDFTVIAEGGDNLTAS